MKLYKLDPIVVSCCKWCPNCYTPPNIAPNWSYKVCRATNIPITNKNIIQSFCPLKDSE